MRKVLIPLFLATAVGGIGCTNMSKSQQGGLSGAALGAAAGAGIAAIADGNALTGALVGGALGGAGGYYMGSQEKQ